MRNVWSVSQRSVVNQSIKAVKAVKAGRRRKDVGAIANGQKNFGDAISPLEHVGQIPKRWEKVVGDVKMY